MIRTPKGQTLTTDITASSGREKSFIKTAEEAICLRMLHDKKIFGLFAADDGDEGAKIH